MRKRWLMEHFELQAPEGRERHHFVLWLPKNAQVLGVRVEKGPDTPGPWLVWTTLEDVCPSEKSKRRFAVVKAGELLPLSENEGLVYVGRLSEDTMYGRRYHVLEIVEWSIVVASQSLATG